MRFNFLLLPVLILAVTFSAACPAPCKISDADVGPVHDDAVPLIAALEKFRAERSDYPKQLEELAPKYVARIPDKFGSRKFSYTRQSATAYELRVASANGEFYSESCTMPEIETLWNKLKGK